MSALREYPAMMEKAQDLQEKLSTYQGQMTPDQAMKFAKLQQKMLSAAYKKMAIKLAELLITYISNLKLRFYVISQYLCEIKIT
jgi:ubiquinone biosynthesis protein UbiJ